MTKEQQISAMVSAAAVLTGLCLVGYYASTIFSQEEEIACGAAASRIEQMNVKAPSGQLMTPIQFQTELGRDNRGIVQRSRVVKVSDAPPDVAIEVSLPKGSASPLRPQSVPGGIVFKWAPDGLKTATSACLRYAVRLPEDFEPGKGGVLPGVFGGTLPPIREISDGTTGFAIHALWRPDGKLEFHPQVPTNKLSNPAMLSRGKYKLARGRWVWIDQKIMLNTPGQNDGAYKLWIDGKLSFEHDQVAWRANADIGLNGISGAVYYGGPKWISSAPVATVIGLSPFQLSWQ